MVLYILQFTNTFFAVRRDCRPSYIVEDSTARLDQMSHQEVAETFLRMGAITRRFLAVVNYRGNPALPLFPRYPQSSSSSALTVRSHVAPSSSSRPPFQAALYPARPLRILPLVCLCWGASSQRSCAYTCTRTRRARTGTTRTRTCTCTSTSTGSFLVPRPCSSARY
jgi:hypothetical protein